MSQVLLFRHPLAGYQLVKGSIQTKEPPKTAAIRELHEESGLIAASAIPSGVLRQSAQHEIWHIFLCDVGNTPDTWTYETQDDDGQVFDFFWHDLDADAPMPMAATYLAVLKHIKAGQSR